MKGFLHTQGTKIVLNNKKVMLRGVNFGGWLMMEGYIMHSLNVAAQVFKKKFEKDLGKQALQEFERTFQANFIQESDVKNVARLGFNCLRIPFHHNLIEKKAYQYDLKGVRILDQIIQWANKYHLWVILDLHGACGSQNHDWHSDSLGPADLWNKESCRNRTFALWEFLADRYKNNTAVAGYDLLNEAVLKNTRLLNSFYREAIRSIRRHDKNHIVFVEGNNWAQDIDCLDNFVDDNLALSIHFYPPLEFTFNFVPHLSYPLKWFKKSTIQSLINRYQVSAKKRNVPILVGEFGVNYREGKYKEDQWLKDVLTSFNRAGFHWTYWTYKAIKNAHYPDGVYSYMENPPWVRREGPQLGWENYSREWRKNKKKMAESWQTKNFHANAKVLTVLKQAARQKS